MYDVLASASLTSDAVAVHALSSCFDLVVCQVDPLVRTVAERGGGGGVGGWFSSFNKNNPIEV